MPRSDVTAKFATTMSKLLDERMKRLAIIAKQTAKVAEIEGLFERFGMSLEARTPGRKAGAKKAVKAGGRRKRGHFKQTATEFILELLKGKALTTKEINVAWTKAGRGGRADTTLMNMAKAETIRRSKVASSAGSVGNSRC